MVQQTQPDAIVSDGQYVVAHQLGHTYTGPSGGFLFINGLLDPPQAVPGWQLRRNGLMLCTHFWAVLPGHELDRVGGVWAYVPVKPAAPSKPKAPKAKAKRKAKVKAK